MICLICRQSETTDGFTEVTFQRGELHLVISHIPAHVCPVCREAYVEQDVAAQLLQSAVDASNAGVRNAHYEYDTA